MTALNPAALGTVRHDWTLAQVQALLELPLLDLLLHAQRVHREHHAPNTVQMSTLLSVKTGACPEDCAYCSQSVRYDTGLERESLMEVAAVRESAARAKAAGATRFCMGAAYRSPKAKDLKVIAAMIRAVRALGMETCATLGMLTPEQARELKDAGLDYYNHNLDTSPEFYGEIITTRTYQDRLDTLDAVRGANLKVCCGGILGMGESVEDRCAMLAELAALEPQPESVPINLLMAVPGTPLQDEPPVEVTELVRTVAVARILMPKSRVRLSAGRVHLSREAQLLALFAGANSIFIGDKLLTTRNADLSQDEALLASLRGNVPADAPVAREA